MSTTSAERGYVKLSRESIDDLVRRHFEGIGGAGQLVMTAIALAESGGVVNVVHDNFESGHQAADSVARYDFGLWQINSQHGFDRTRLLMDPEYNAGAAAEILDRQGLSAWVAWKSDRYLEFMEPEDGNGNGDSDVSVPVGDDAIAIDADVRAVLDNIDASFRRFDTSARLVFLTALASWRESLTN